jgi:hypothetical protein
VLNLFLKRCNQLIALTQFGFQLGNALITRVYWDTIRRSLSLDHNRADYATGGYSVQRAT